ncbi:acid-sensing ion channel 1A-like isoform X2 [Panulirus ornatus]|uniref:acid-sensing ion channel 1A-like isoform X2 n=1 Tax=Panulirus ornatus TaxID=150431 RepID=UPI003A8424E3
MLVMADRLAGGENRRGLWTAEVGVGVAGVSTLLSPWTSCFRKILWAWTLLVSLLVLVTVVGSRLAYFFSYPVNVDVQVIHNASLKFPAITICPSPRKLRLTMDPSAVREVYENITGREYPGLLEAQKALVLLLDAKELWDRTSWNISAMVDECYQGRGRPCNTTGHFHATYTMFGSCLTYTGTPATLAGSYHGLYLKLDPEAWVKEPETVRPQGWWVVVHEAEDDPSLLIKTHGYLVSLSWNKEISLSLKQFQSLSTKRKPCRDDPAYRQTHCLNDCFSRAFVRTLRCRLPFMRGAVPYCRGLLLLNKAGRQLDEMLIEGRWEPQQCRCGIPCHQTVYQYRGDTTDNRLDDKARIKMFFLDLVYEEVKEELSYPFASLVADFGGMAGLLLGASLLTVLEVLECAVVGLARLYARHRGLIPPTYHPKDVLPCTPAAHTTLHTTLHDQRSAAHTTLHTTLHDQRSAAHTTLHTTLHDQRSAAQGGHHTYTAHVSSHDAWSGDVVAALYDPASVHDDCLVERNPATGGGPTLQQEDAGHL